jgi:hypothetical protein
MKRSRIRGWLAMLLILVSLLSAFEGALAASFTRSKAAMRVGSSTYKIGSTSKTWKSKLGRYTRKSYDACAEGCKSYMYNFSRRGVKVETIVKANRKEYISGIIITRRRVGTAAGLKVGHSLSTMVRLYGKGYSKSGTTYTYRSGGRGLRVKSRRNKVSSITIF